MSDAIEMSTGTAIAKTLSDKAAAWVAEAILSGRVEPGARLHIAELSRQTGIGMTPLREALSRLTTRGLVVAWGQKGFRVAETSPDDLVDIVRMRTHVEVEALRRSMRLGDEQWEADLLSALHLMLRYQERNSDDSVLKADALHKRFHTALIAACGSPRMLEAHSLLYSQGYRYRRLMLPALGTYTHVADNHRLLAERAIERSEEACEILAGQLRKPLELIFPDAVGKLDL